MVVTIQQSDELKGACAIIIVRITHIFSIIIYVYSTVLVQIFEGLEIPPGSHSVYRLYVTKMTIILWLYPIVICY